MLVVIVTLSCLLVMMRGWINFAGNSGPQQGFHNMHFLQILKWMKLVWDLGILNKHLVVCVYLGDLID